MSRETPAGRSRQSQVVAVVQRGARRVQLREVVGEGGGRATQPQLQAADLPHADLNLSSRTYLTVPQLMDYGGFVSMNAVYCWLHDARIPKCRRGRVLLLLRRDVDTAFQAAAAKHRT